ncbi:MULTISPECIES: hypothetical protein [unclassified Streptomyces]|uniref:hypothetical protein n=1 Tax=unclassified Streptomyces TaxID=2593676 RepID=UPI0035DEA382
MSQLCPIRGFARRVRSGFDDIPLSRGAPSHCESLLVAIPVLVGSLGRIPVGALTDK